jgi:DNA ligase-associated metallophosphoesterase
VTRAVWALPRGDARLELLAERAAFDPDRELLLVADAHFGKAVSFRRLGVPVPAGTTADALARLDRLLAATGARHVVFLGDFLHSAKSQRSAALAAIGDWRARHVGLELTLVRGNHDARAGDPPAALGIEVVDEPLEVGPWSLQHHPRPAPGRYAIAGHLHPGIVVGGRGHDRLRLPCFHFGAEVGVLPAFGGFTGLAPVRRDPGDRLWALVDGDVVEVPTPRADPYTPAP